MLQGVSKSCAGGTKRATSVNIYVLRTAKEVHKSITHIYIYIYIYIHTYIHRYVHKHMCVYLYIYIYIHTYTYTYRCVYIHMYVYVCMYIYIYIYTYMFCFFLGRPTQVHTHSSKCTGAAGDRTTKGLAHHQRKVHIWEKREGSRLVMLRRHQT